MSDSFTGIFDAVSSSDRKQPQFALVVYSSPEVSAAVDVIRCRYDPAFKAGIQTHITIKRPAVLSNLALLPAMTTALKTATQNLAPFRVELEGYGLFHNPGRHVVFIKVRDERPLYNLHKSVAQALQKVLPNAGLDQFEGDHYHPHLTIGNELDDLELAVIEYELKSSGYCLNFSFTVSEVALLSQPSNQPWETTSIFTFGLK
ncbi:MAG: 2'-5' RNA ligase family protein [Chloroflexota bacterium]|nr:2'-5' RNA ligase family protein [Chloroflexota bacterium]